MKTMSSTPPKQTIEFVGEYNGDEGYVMESGEVEVSLLPWHKDRHYAGSNRVKVTTLVNFFWGDGYYNGNLIAVHHCGDIFAFTLSNSDGGSVRVMSRKSMEDRALIRGFTGRVLDLSFAHGDQILLAAIDENGALLVHLIDRVQGSLVTTLVFETHSSLESCQYNRVIWCPSWPGEVEDIDNDNSSFQDCSRILAFTHSSQVKILDLGRLSVKNVPLASNEYIHLTSHSEPVVDAVFSPDGSALATASLDGYVRFFQINWEQDESPDNRVCLHEWQPHRGQPMSFFAFLDDLKCPGSDSQFWKFAVTGCNQNQELKVWSCETWHCLQTIRFLLPDCDERHVSLKACIDATANYLALADAVSKVLYILQISRDCVTCFARVISISSFPLALPCLSVVVAEATKRHFRPSSSDSHLDEVTTGDIDHVDMERSLRDDGENEGSTTPGVQLRLFAVHNKKLQELLIRYCSIDVLEPVDSRSSKSAFGDVLCVAGSEADEDVVTNGDLLLDAPNDLSKTEASTVIYPDAQKVIDPDVPEVTCPDISAMSTLPSDVAPLISPCAFTLPAGTMQSSVPTDLSIEDSYMTSSTSSLTHVTALTDSNQCHLMSPPMTFPDDSLSSTVVSSKSTVSIQSPESAAGSSPGSEFLSPRVDCVCDEEKKGEGDQVVLNGDIAIADVVSPDVGSSEVGIPLSPASNSIEFGPVSDLRDLPSSDTAGDGALVNNGHQTGASSDLGSTVGTAMVVMVEEESHSVEDLEDKEVVVVMMEASPEFRGHHDVTAVGQPTGMAERTTSRMTEQSQPFSSWPPVPDVPRLDDALCHEDGALLSEGLVVNAVVEYNRVGDHSNEDLVAGHYTEQTGDMSSFDQQGDLKSLMATMVDNMGQLSQDIQQQHQEFSFLQRYVQDQHHMQVDMHHQCMEQIGLCLTVHSPGKIQADLKHIQESVTSHVEHSMVTVIQNMRTLSERLSAIENLQANQLSLLNEAVTNVGSKLGILETAVKEEFHHNITPVVTRMTDQLKNDIHMELSQKLTATDAVLKDQVGKMVRSKHLNEAVIGALKEALHLPVQAQLREMAEKNLIPAFSQATQCMTSQINAALQAGYREYVSEMKQNAAGVLRDLVSGQSAALTQLHGLLETSGQQLQEQLVSAARAEIVDRISAVLSSLKDQLVLSMRDVVKEEVSMAMKEHTSRLTDSMFSCLRSGAGTPVPSASAGSQISVQAQQEQIRSLISRKRLNEAFQTALSLTNLDMVVFTCQLVDSGILFNSTPCPLTQPVLLSLIQQLSANLSSHFALKIKYLTDSITMLDMSSHLAQEHGAQVVQSLAGKLRAHQLANPPNKEVKLLLMATMSLLNK